MNKISNTDLREPATPSGEQCQIEQLIEVLIDKDETISYRSIARALDISASSVTRSTRRRSFVDAAIQRQQALRAWSKKARKQSQKYLVDQITEKDQQIEELRSQVALLTASHKALILAIGETGGYSAWQKFFESYEHIREIRCLFPPETRGRN